MGLAKLKLNASFSVIVMLIQIILLIPLTKLMGIKGSALSFLISMCIAPLFLFYTNMKMLKISNLFYITNTVIRPVIIAVFQAFLIKIILLKYVNSMLSLVLLFSLSIIINPVCSWILNAFEKDEKLQIIEYFRKITPLKNRAKWIT
jgi:hypothetical protein